MPVEVTLQMSNEYQEQDRKAGMKAVRRDMETRFPGKDLTHAIREPDKNTLILTLPLIDSVFVWQIAEVVRGDLQRAFDQAAQGIAPETEN